MPSSNSIRFKAIGGLPQSFEKPGSFRFRRLLREETNSSTLVSLAEFGVARKFEKHFDERYGSVAQNHPRLKKVVNSSLEACVRLCVETVSCRSWYLDEASVCFLYYVIVHGYPMEGVVSGDFDPPTTMLPSGSITTDGGYACVCGGRGSVKKAVTVATRAGILGNQNSGSRTNTSLSSVVDNAWRRSSMLPEISASHASLLDNSTDEWITSTIDNTFKDFDSHLQGSFVNERTRADQVCIVVYKCYVFFW